MVFWRAGVSVLIHAGSRPAQRRRGPTGLPAGTVHVLWPVFQPCRRRLPRSGGPHLPEGGADLL